VPVHKHMFLLAEVGRIGAEGGRVRGPLDRICYWARGCTASMSARAQWGIEPGDQPGLSMAPRFSSKVAPQNSPFWRAGDQPGA
jgi:hypothetical protein